MKTSHDHLISTMEISIPGKMVFILKQGPGFHEEEFQVPMPSHCREIMKNANICFLVSWNKFSKLWWDVTVFLADYLYHSHKALCTAQVIVDYSPVWPRLCCYLHDDVTRISMWMQAHSADPGYLSAVFPSPCPAARSSWRVCHYEMCH